MENPNYEIKTQQNKPTTNSSFEPLVSNQSSHKKNKIVLFITLFLVLIVLLLFAPIPYYQIQNVKCKVGAVNCPTTDWHLGSSLWKSLNPNYTSGSPTEESYISTPSPTPLPAEASTMEEIPSPIPTIDETANWKTYTNTTYGYLIKYPEGNYLQFDANIPPQIEQQGNKSSVMIAHCLSKDISKCVGSSINGLNIAISTKPREMNLDSWLKTSGLYEVLSAECITNDQRSKKNNQKFLNKEAITYEYTIDEVSVNGSCSKDEFGGSGDNKQIIINHDQYVIVLSTVFTTKDIRPELDQILSTFKFTQ